LAEDVGHKRDIRIGFVIVSARLAIQARNVTATDTMPRAAVERRSPPRSTAARAAEYQRAIAVAD